MITSEQDREFLQLVGEALPENAFTVQVDPIEEFAAIDEEGAQPLVGDAENVLIPEGGDVMVYGEGGAGKTSLTIDLGCHLAAGRDWLDLPVGQPARILIIENEGPRPLLRAKLRRKLNAWAVLRSPVVSASSLRRGRASRSPKNSGAQPSLAS